MGVTCGVEEGQLLHFDNEQSRSRFHKTMLSALSRANETFCPDWLHAFWMTDVPAVKRRHAIFATIRNARQRGPIRAVFLDGIANIALRPNDEMEAIELIDSVQQLAIECDTVIWCVIHENLGGLETGKTRGHLGSELQRKAETNLRIIKDGDGVSVLVSEYSRTSYFTKEQGPRFAYDEALGMYMPVSTRGDERAQSKYQDALADAEAVFDGVAGSLGYAELLRRISEVFGLRPDGAKRRWKNMKEAGVISKNANDKWRVKL